MTLSAADAEIKRILELGPKDYYRFLNVPEDADKQAIHAAYKRLMVIIHPDHNKDNEGAHSASQRKLI